jgi:hypothetical protein
MDKNNCKKKMKRDAMNDIIEIDINRLNKYILKADNMLKMAKKSKERIIKLYGFINMLKMSYYVDETRINEILKKIAEERLYIRNMFE